MRRPVAAWMGNGEQCVIERGDVAELKCPHAARGETARVEES